MSVLASDSFNRANENPLASPWGGLNNINDQSMDLVSNAATWDASNTGQDARSWYDGGISWPNDQYSKAQLTVTGTAGGGSGPGLTVRNDTVAKTYYRFCIDHAASLNWKLRVTSAGTSTTLATGTQAFTDGDTFNMLVVGTSLTVQLNGAAAFATGSDGAIASGNPGMAYSSTETSISVDVWEGGDNSGSSWPIFYDYGAEPAAQMWDWVGIY